MSPVWQVLCGGQQALPSPPQSASAWQAPRTQTNPVPHVFPAQQGSRSPPQRKQKPLEAHTRSFPEHVPPGQHGSKSAPQGGAQMPSRQTSPVPQGTTLSQQIWLAWPQDRQIPLRQRVSPRHAGVVGQQGCSGAPQGRQMRISPSDTHVKPA